VSERTTIAQAPLLSWVLLREDFAMRIHNVYEDANGESHFRNIEVESTPKAISDKLCAAPGSNAASISTHPAVNHRVGMLDGADRIDLGSPATSGLSMFAHEYF
jgi:hypothetical protein